MNRFSERGEAWLLAERDRLAREWSRDDFIRWLVWNDRNGSFTDEDCEAEGFEPLTHESALDLVMRFVVVNRETPEEMRALSRRR